MLRDTRTHRTTIEVDIAAYREARAALGTGGYKETVNEALRAVGRREQLRRGAESIRSGTVDLVSPDELADMRRPRFE